MYATARVREEPIRIVLRGRTVNADLAIPDGAEGLIIVTHGSGSSRFSTRSRSVATALWASGFATMLIDLLSPSEERAQGETRNHRFQTQVLAERLITAIDWAGRDPRTRGMPIGLLGSGAGADASIVAAARRVDAVAAVVCRGAHPDRAGTALAELRAPTLLLAPSSNDMLVALCRSSLRHFHAVARLEVVVATNLDEPAALDRVVSLARLWLLDHVPLHAASVPRAVSA